MYSLDSALMATCASFELETSARWVSLRSAVSFSTRFICSLTNARFVSSASTRAAISSVSSRSHSSFATAATEMHFTFFSSVSSSFFSALASLASSISSRRALFPAARHSALSRARTLFSRFPSSLSRSSMSCRSTRSCSTIATSISSTRSRSKVLRASPSLRIRTSKQSPKSMLGRSARASISTGFPFAESALTFAKCTSPTSCLVAILASRLAFSSSRACFSCARRSRRAVFSFRALASRSPSSFQRRSPSSTRLRPSSSISSS
mmetsp:Transcript_11772/g.23354  ORF Transcript_11772/g.23354 Transcript_11772/m.23354 type:complete len:266 (+) Transcript_11772:304-1101(+)